MHTSSLESCLCLAGDDGPSTLGRPIFLLSVILAKRAAGFGEEGGALHDERSKAVYVMDVVCVVQVVIVTYIL